MNDDCILWAKCTNRNGYGIQRMGNRNALAHRLAFVQYHGLALDDIAGLSVRHKCDTPACVNPAHLEIGSHADNMKDMRDRKRACSGEQRPNAKLTAAQVTLVRSMYIPYDKEFGGAALARRFNVNQSSISNAIRGVTWT